MDKCATLDFIIWVNSFNCFVFLGFSGSWNPGYWFLSIAKSRNCRMTSGLDSLDVWSSKYNKIVDVLTVIVKVKLLEFHYFGNCSEAVERRKVIVGMSTSNIISSNFQLNRRCLSFVFKIKRSQFRYFSVPRKRFGLKPYLLAFLCNVGKEIYRKIRINWGDWLLTTWSHQTTGQ